MAKDSKYGEITKMVCFRVPESKVSEINKMVKIKLNEYEKDFILNGLDVSEVEILDSVAEKPIVEKKSNPADVVDKPQATFGFIHPPKKEVVLEDLEAAKKAKIELARSIVSGVGPKSVDSVIGKKIPLEERYDFEEGMSLPDNEYRVAIGSKGIAFTDMYNTSLIYLRFGHRTLQFNNKKEFDRFVKEESVLL